MKRDVSDYVRMDNKRIVVMEIGDDVDSSAISQSSSGNWDLDLQHSESTSICNEDDLKYNYERLPRNNIKCYKYTELKKRDADIDTYEKRLDDVSNTDYFVIVLGKEFFSIKDDDKLIKELKKKCARIINPYIDHYASAHNSKVCPIIFVISGSEGYYKRFDKEKIVDIFSEALSISFNKEIHNYIMYNDIRKQNGSSIPIMLCIYDELIKAEKKIRNDFELEKKEIQNRIKSEEEFLDWHDNRVMKFLSSRKASNARYAIGSLNSELAQREKAFDNNAVKEQKIMFKESLEKELGRNHKCLIYGFDEFDYQKYIIEENDFCLGLLIITLIIASLTGIWFPVIGAGVVALTQIYFAKKGKIPHMLINSAICSVIYLLHDKDTLNSRITFVMLIIIVSMFAITSVYKIIKKKRGR